MGLREGFEERRRMGFGKFIDSTVLRANEHRRVVDLLRGISGIRFVLRSPSCAPGGRTCAPPELWALSGRTARVGGECPATIMMDGNTIYESNDHRDPRTGVLLKPPPHWNREFYVSEFEAIEVYRSAAELPIEFSGPSGQCGVIMLWTRRGGKST
ncbi:MAG: hypothetical protein ACT4PM_05965, partial [Gemmatimonadales bacterium]